MANSPPTNTVAVYCGSSLGKRKAYHNAALSVGHALAKAKRTLVYGGGSEGIMGLVSGAVQEGGGKVVGIIPYAMVSAGGEGRNGLDIPSSLPQLSEIGRENVETIVVNSMNERKVEMAKRAAAFVGLPGGFGTLDEVFEVVTWNQIGIHEKPIVLVNVCAFFDPLRNLIQNSVREGFIQPQYENFIIFVDGPADRLAHETYDWGEAVIQTLDNWKPTGRISLYNWNERKGGERVESRLESS